MKSGQIKALYAVGGVGAVLGILGWFMKLTWAPLLFVVGVALISLSRINIIMDPKSDLPGRIKTILFLSSGSLLYAAWLMYNNGSSWALFAFISAVIDFYISFRIPSQK